MDLSATLLTPSRTTDPSFISSITSHSVTGLQSIKASQLENPPVLLPTDREQPILKQQLNYLDLSPSFLCITVLGLDLS